MMAEVRRLRPRSHDRTTQALQLVLDLPLRLRPETRADLTDALSSYAPEPWPYVMLSRERSRTILRQIYRGPRPGVTLAVWTAALSYAAYGTGEIEASRTQLAELVGTTEREVSRALSRLVEIGALIRTARGHYALHPSTAWAGSLASREAAEKQAPPLQLIEPG